MPANDSDFQQPEFAAYDSAAYISEVASVKVEDQQNPVQENAGELIEVFDQGAESRIEAKRKAKNRRKYQSTVELFVRSSDLFRQSQIKAI